MKRIFTLFQVKLLFAALFTLTYGVANATFTPVAVTGFKHDVIAEGINTPFVSTTIAFDSAVISPTATNYVLIAPDFQNNATAPLPTKALPATGLINSANTLGLSFQLAPYSGPNSLRLIGTSGANAVDSLVFPTTQSYIGDIYILASAGSGSANMTATVNFVGGGTQTFTATVPDWFATNTTYAIQDIGRAARPSGALAVITTPDPKLWEFKITLNLVNYLKTIRSITFQRTGGSSTTSTLNVMGVSVDNQTCLPVQNSVAGGGQITFSNITMTTADVTWPAVAGATSYEWAATTSATPPAVGTNVSTTTSATIGGLNNGTSYYFHIRNKCSATSYSIWTTAGPFSTVTCPPVPSGTISVTGITTVSANISWTGLSGWNGYQVGVNTSSSTPPATPATQTATTYSAINLLPGTTYYFWIRNMCPSPSNSVWTSKSFTTSPCPVAGTPTIQTNVPFSVTYSWPGTTTPGMVDYQYQVNTSTTPGATLWTNTSNTTATVNGLTPGVTYYAHVRSNCGTTQSSHQYVQFVNPYPDCYEPAAMNISNINMHGAHIEWMTSAGTSPLGYQYSVTTNPNPPASGTATTDTFYNVTSLVGGQKYYVHVRTRCGSTVAPVYSNFSAWAKDSFTTTTVCVPINPPVITNVTASTADVSWNDYPGIYGYEYVIDTSVSDPTIAGAAINFNTIAVASLLSGTNYYFHLRVRCDTVNYSPWVTQPFSTAPVCVTTPVNPSVTTVTPTTATLTWAGVPGAQQYQYGVTTTPAPPQTTNTYTSQTSVQVQSLTPSTAYYFHVRAYCSPSDLSEWESLPFSTISVGIGSIGGGKGYDVVVYPNPVKDVLNIEVSGKMNGKGVIMLYNLSGKKLKEIEIKDARAELDMQQFAQGMYILKYKDGESAGTMKIQKL